MQINSIASKLLTNALNKTENATTKEDAFSVYLEKAMDGWDKTNQLQKISEQVTTDFMLGKTDDISAVTIASEKAYIALQYTVKIRDTLLESFNEIMRMQV